MSAWSPRPVSPTTGSGSEWVRPTRDRLADSAVGGGVPFHEPGLDPLRRRRRRVGPPDLPRLQCRGRRGAAAVFLAVPTPAGLDGSADLSAVESAIRSIASVTTEPTPSSSSSPRCRPGSWRRIEAWMEEAGCAGSLVVNPEFLQEGKAVEGVLNPARVVVGSTDPAAADLVARLHAPFGAPVLRDRPRLGRADQVRRQRLPRDAGDLRQLHRQPGRSAWAPTSPMSSRGSASTPGSARTSCSPGPGYGGSCFPKDLPALIATACRTGPRPGPPAGGRRCERSPRPVVVIDKLADALGSLDGQEDRSARPRLQGRHRRPRRESRPSASPRRWSARAPRWSPMTRLPRLVIDGVVQVDSALGGPAGMPMPRSSPPSGPSSGRWIPPRWHPPCEGDVVVDARNMMDKQAAEAAGLDYRGMGR